MKHESDPFDLEQFYTQSASMTKEEMLEEMLERMKQIECKLQHPSSQGYSREELLELSKLSVLINVALLDVMTRRSLIGPRKKNMFYNRRRER